jgi:phosphoribosylaminoimidazolecarboxamide formyltransferase/IMP cyclohydrolase
VRALISTWDKSGLDTFARGLVELGWRLVASGNTAAALEAIGLPVEHVEAVTESPEMLGGRVKTLHPRVHAGILARRDEAEDVATLEEHGIEAFDLVCVNLYPFEDVTARHGVTEEEAVEMIDIGGPSMLRGAAKNFAFCAPVCRPDQYGPVLEELRTSGELSLETRRRLAAEAFAHTAAYEAAIATWFNARDEFPDSLVVSLDKVLDLAYGENPHQRAAYYAERGSRRHLLSRVEQLHGKELSFNNLNDFSAARSLASSTRTPAASRSARPPRRRTTRPSPRTRRRPTAASSSSTARSRRRSARSSRSNSSRCSSRRVTRKRRSTHYDARRTHASSSTENGAPASPASATTSASSAGCSYRTTTPGSRIARAGSS